MKDCQGDRPCNGRPSSYKEVYDSFNICCSMHTWWFQDCDGYDPDGKPISLSNKWYFTSGASDDRMCVKECDGPEEYCGGAAENWEEVYDSFNECCRFHLWYNIDCSSFDEYGRAKSFDQSLSGK